MPFLMRRSSSFLRRRFWPRRGRVSRRIRGAWCHAVVVLLAAEIIPLRLGWPVSSMMCSIGATTLDTPAMRRYAGGCSIGRVRRRGGAAMARPGIPRARSTTSCGSSPPGIA